MMIPFILNTAEQHSNSRTQEAHLRSHAAAIAEMQAEGSRVQIHESASLLARINHGRWIVDCECGAGNATHPEWRIALCFACGASHAVVFPDDWDEIERVLVQRISPENRNWTPGETVAELLTENADHGIYPKEVG